MNDKKIIRPLKVLVLLSSLIVSLGLFPACSTENAYQVGPVKHSIDPLDQKERTWRGGAIGAALSSPIKGKLIEISLRASMESARQGRPIAYLSLDGFQRVEAFPVEKGETPNCPLIREQVFQGGKLIQDEIKEVCP